MLRAGVPVVDATVRVPPREGVSGSMVRTDLDGRFELERWDHRMHLDVERTYAEVVLDPGEVAYLREPGSPTVFTIADIDKRGISAIAEEALQIASGAGFLHLSLDLDALDPHDAPGVGTPVRGGLTYREAHTLMETFAAAPFTSMDVVEVNPVLDMGNVTAELAAELVCSLFGKSII